MNWRHFKHVGRKRWKRAVWIVAGIAAFVWLASQSRPLYTTPMCLIYGKDGAPQGSSAGR